MELHQYLTSTLVVGYSKFAKTTIHVYHLYGFQYKDSLLLHDWYSLSNAKLVIMSYISVKEIFERFKNILKLQIPVTAWVSVSRQLSVKTEYLQKSNIHK